jgi:DNA-binding transcriptional regulator PaaX
MAKRPAFMTAYPLTAKAAVHTPLVFRAGLFSGDGLPWPSLEGIRDFACFAGIEDGAIRTALSRAKREGSVLAQADGIKRARYVLAPETFARGLSQVRADQRPEGFLLAVFSFSAPEQEERASLRALLKSYGFRKLAQNTYIHGRIDTVSLVEAVRGLGLEKNFFLFTCPDIEDESLVARVLSLFDLESRRKELDEYLRLLGDFLPEELALAAVGDKTAGGLAAGDKTAGDEFARRLLYVAAVHWERVEASEPPIPARHLPPGYAFGKIQAFYGRRLAEGRQAMFEYFRRVFEA